MRRLESGEHTIQTYLVKRSKDGDRQAQNELYRLHVDAMYNICRRITGDEEEAKDVLQDSFIDAFTKIHTLEHEVTFSAWLKRIEVNKCINALRKNKNDMSSLEEPDLQITADEGPYDDSITKKGAMQIMNALDMISEGCRTVFNLYLFEGYDHKEIGQILSISESASKAQYSKAKSKIRYLLENTDV